MQVREGLSRLEGVESIGEQPSISTQTCEARMKDGRLPDLEALSRLVQGLGIGARLRGVEATVEGELVEERGDLVFRLARTGQPLRLAPLGRVVQWNFKNRRPARAARSEREAYRRLVGRVGPRARRVRITGPLVPQDDRTSPVLEVRRYDLEPHSKERK